MTTAGEVLELGGMGREAPGLDLVGAFVGSEGCFGIATEIEVELVPLADSVRTLLAIFDDECFKGEQRQGTIGNDNQAFDRVTGN